MNTARLKSHIGLTVMLWTAAILAPPFAGLAQTTNTVLSLDGNGDYVSIPSAPELQNPDALTIEAWIYPRQASVNNPFFINKGDAADGGSPRTYELRWVANGGETGPGNRVEFFVFLSNGGWVVVGAPAAENTWIHVAGCFSSSRGVAELFTNGIAAAVKTNDVLDAPLSGASLRQSTLPVRLGRVDYPPYNYANGFMDEVRIWTKARAAAEIARDQFCTLTGTESNLVAYWTFDDGTANDQTGHGHNGTFTGDAQVRVITGTVTNRPALYIKSAANLWMNVTLLGEFGGSYRIQSSANLTDWLDWQSVTHSFGRANCSTDSARTSLFVFAGQSCRSPQAARVAGMVLYGYIWRTVKKTVKFSRAYEP